MFWENFKLALDAMRTSKLRTALSLLGIVIGVGAVVAILNLGSSVTENITGSLAQGGSDIISVYPTPNERTKGVFDIQFSDTLMNSTDGIQTISPVMSSRATLRTKENTATSSMLGCESTYFDTQNITFDTGRGFTAQQNIDSNQVVVLGSDIAKTLFPESSAVGKNVTFIMGDDGIMHTFEVIGVLDEKEQSYTMSYNNSVYIPLNTYSRRLINNKVVSTYIIKLKSGYDTEVVSDQINKFMDSIVGSDGYETFSPAMIAKMASQVTASLSLFLAAIAGISLLVGGIGIMNIMLVSVAERTKEIGIRKALGASPSVIRGQFIVEALTLTLVGGILGIIFGCILSYAVVNIAGWTLKLSYNSFIIAVGFSMIVGIFFGWYPAMMASRLDPIEALNYE
ncbi:MAG: ABC transporter permease [Sphaerochaetaceae bacterium]